MRLRDVENDRLTETFDAFMAELMKRKPQWTRSERELFEAIILSLGNSIIRDVNNVTMH